ncbi:hypothetical protein Mal65_07780 [Crateriforma conspicua]|nr:hypothetical protein Mal65_07780 [Crateriforma conspicua]
MRKIEQVVTHLCVFHYGSVCVRYRHKVLWANSGFFIGVGENARWYWLHQIRSGPTSPHVLCIVSVLPKSRERQVTGSAKTWGVSRLEGADG